MKLEGLKVVDLSWFLPGPYLTTALARRSESRRLYLTVPIVSQ